MTAPNPGQSLADAFRACGDRIACVVELFEAACGDYNAAADELAEMTRQAKELAFRNAELTKRAEAAEKRCVAKDNRIDDDTASLNSIHVQLATVTAERDKLRAELESAARPVPMVLHCPECRARHVDEGDFATKTHHTHSCQSCGLTWRPAVVPTVGVRFLPGFKNELPVTGSPPSAPENRCTCGDRDTHGAMVDCPEHGVNRAGQGANEMGAPGGPRCACGKPSAAEDGSCSDCIAQWAAKLAGDLAEAGDVETTILGAAKKVCDPTTTGDETNATHDEGECTERRHEADHRDITGCGESDEGRDGQCHETGCVESHSQSARGTLPGTGRARRGEGSVSGAKETGRLCRHCNDPKSHHHGPPEYHCLGSYGARMFEPACPEPNCTGGEGHGR